MRIGSKVAAVLVLGLFLLTGFDKALAGPQAKKSESGRTLELKDLPLPVIDAAQKQIPSIGFLSVEKQSSWRRGQYYRIWAMDDKQRQLYMEISASGKVIERPRLVKEKESQAK
jgi:hypothetical protein